MCCNNNKPLSVTVRQSLVIRWWGDPWPHSHLQQQQQSKYTGKLFLSKALFGFNFQACKNCIQSKWHDKIYLKDMTFGVTDKGK